MNEVNAGLSVIPEGFSATSVDELDQVEGGLGFWVIAVGAAIAFGLANHNATEYGAYPYGYSHDNPKGNAGR